MPNFLLYEKANILFLHRKDLLIKGTLSALLKPFFELSGSKTAYIEQPVSMVSVEEGLGCALVGGSPPAIFPSFKTYSDNSRNPDSIILVE